MLLLKYFESRALAQCTDIRAFFLLMFFLLSLCWSRLIIYFQTITLNDRNLVAMIMWLLWCRRNMLLDDGKGWDCAELIQKACDLSSEYLHAISCSEDIRSRLVTQLNLLFGVLQRKRSMSMLLSYSVQMQLNLAGSSGW